MYDRSQSLTIRQLSAVWTRFAAVPAPRAAPRFAPRSRTGSAPPSTHGLTRSLPSSRAPRVAAPRVRETRPRAQPAAHCRMQVATPGSRRASCAGSRCRAPPKSLDQADWAGALAQGEPASDAPTTAAATKPAPATSTRQTAGTDGLEQPTTTLWASTDDLTSNHVALIWPNAALLPDYPS